MSLIGQANSPEIIEYNDATSERHAARCAERAAREQIDFIAVPALVTSATAKADFALDYAALGIPAGDAFIFKDSGLLEASGRDFQKHLLEETRRRSWINLRRQSKSTGRWSTVKRNRPNPVQRLVVNLSPWQMRFLRASGNSNDIRHRVFSLVTPVSEAFARESGRIPLAVAIHWDSSKVHLTLFHTRVGMDHNLHGRARLQTIGPWSVAQERIERLGIGPPDSRLKQNLERFHERHGAERSPLDAVLHRTLDNAFERGLNKKEAGVYRECQEFYRCWKMQQRSRVETLRNPQGFALSVLKFASPLFPPPVRKVVQMATTLMPLLRLLRDLMGGGGGGGGGGNPLQVLSRTVNDQPSVSSTHKNKRRGI